MKVDLMISDDDSVRIFTWTDVGGNPEAKARGLIETARRRLGPTDHEKRADLPQPRTLAIEVQVTARKSEMVDYTDQLLDELNNLDIIDSATVVAVSKEDMPDGS